MKASQVHFTKRHVTKREKNLPVLVEPEFDPNSVSV